MRVGVSLFLLTFLSVWISSCADNAGPPPIFLIAEDVSTSLLNANSDLNIGKAYMVNGSKIDPDNDGYLNDSILRNYLLENFTRDFSGYLILDWEERGLERLNTNPKSATQETQIQEFLRGLQIVHSVLPSAKAGYYAIPFRYYYNRNATWRALNDTAQRIIDASDAVFPSVYVFYLSSQVGRSANLDYISDNIKEALRMAGNKPVFPFIWARVHNSNTTSPYRTFDSADFQAYVTGALQTLETNSKKNSRGIVWWGSDKYWANMIQTTTNPSDPLYSQAQAIKTAFDAERLGGESYTTYIDRIHTQVLSDFRTGIDAFRSAP
ncbi:MAG: hypothetical protein J0L93_00165 [Deltaproteobacteria bacterium]|nr:hypothetical protein [Deltaproteobacteria bacterium]